MQTAWGKIATGGDSHEPAVRADRHPQRTIVHLDMDTSWRDLLARWDQVAAVILLSQPPCRNHAERYSGKGCYQRGELHEFPANHLVITRHSAPRAARSSPSAESPVCASKARRSSPQPSLQWR